MDLNLVIFDNFTDTSERLIVFGNIQACLYKEVGEKYLRLMSSSHSTNYRNSNTFIISTSG